MLMVQLNSFVFKKSCCRIHVDGAVGLLSERNNVLE